MRLVQATFINALAYRGDTRPPEEIFIDGLWNRQQPEAHWLRLLAAGAEDDSDPHKPVVHHNLTEHQLQLWEKGSKDCDPAHPGQRVYRVWLKTDPTILVTYTFPPAAMIPPDIRTYLWKHYAKNKPEYREGGLGEDINPSSAVCLTLRPYVAPYFPIDGCELMQGEWIWIYAVLLGAAYKTYAMQEARGQLGASYSGRASEMSVAKEVAVEHISPSDIICAVRCWRKGTYPYMEFVLSHRTCWNHRSRSRLLCQRQIAAALDPYRGLVTRLYKSVIQWRKIKKWAFEDVILLEPNYPYHVWQR